MITVSNISSGAGSVALLARPALPSTDSTSGKARMMRFCSCSSSAALVTLNPGNAAGMNSSDPSSSCGMNSLPICRTGHRLASITASATPNVNQRQRNTP